jgi:hypothetical protein
MDLGLIKAWISCPAEQPSTFEERHFDASQLRTYKLQSELKEPSDLE